MTLQPVRRCTAGLAVAALLTACGSTVQGASSSEGTSGLSGPVGLASQGPADVGSALQGSTQLGSSPGRGGGSSGTATGSGTSGGSGSSSVPDAAASSTLPGVGGSLKVGIPYIDQQQTSTFTASFGAGLAAGDDLANYRVIIDDLNKRGGILGRKVVPVFHRIDFTESAAQYEQETCTDFTQDHKVPFVLNGSSPTLTKCLTDHGVAVLGDGSQINTRDYDAYHYYVQPGSFALDRLASLQATEFSAMGLFKGATPAKIGILFYDLPAYHYAEQVLAAGLRRQGLQVVVEEAFHYAASTQDLGQTQAQVQSAVLKFRSAGVTHVVGVELNAWLQGFFALYGSQQDYYPRYGWTSDQVPTNVQAVVPAKALVGSLFIGFYPTYDSNDESVYPLATRACLALLRSHGIQISSGNQRSQAVVDCDSVRYLALALSQAKGLTRESLVIGARLLGHTFTPAVTYASFLPRGLGAGAAAVRPGAWNTACSCFAYTGSAHAVA